MVGGQDGFRGDRKKTVAYNPATNNVRQLGDLNVGRIWHALVENKGELYAAGGWPTTNSVEKFNPATETWTLTEATLSKAVHSFALLKMPGTVSDYCGSSNRNLVSYSKFNLTTPSSGHRV